MPEPTHAPTTERLPATPDASAPTALDERLRAFLAAPNFASLATVDPDGAPRQAVVWYDFRGDRILVNSRSDRRWPRNMRRDPRVSLAVFDPVDGYSWVGITGVVASIDDDPTRALRDIQGLDARYHPEKPEPGTQFIGQSRVTFLIRIVAVHDHLE